MALHRLITAINRYHAFSIGCTMAAVVAALSLTCSHPSYAKIFQPSHQSAVSKHIPFATDYRPHIQKWIRLWYLKIEDTCCCYRHRILALRAVRACLCVCAWCDFMHLIFYASCGKATSTKMMLNGLFLWFIPYPNEVSVWLSYTTIKHRSTLWIVMCLLSICSVNICSLHGHKLNVLGLQFISIFPFFNFLSTEIHQLCIMLWQASQNEWVEKIICVCQL